MSGDERKIGTEIIAEYRRQEVIARDNDIDGKTADLDKFERWHGGHGFEREQLRREISACDHSKYLP